MWIKGSVWKKRSRKPDWQRFRLWPLSAGSWRGAGNVLWLYAIIMSLKIHNTGSITFLFFFIALLVKFELLTIHFATKQQMNRHGLIEEAIRCKITSFKCSSLHKYGLKSAWKKIINHKWSQLAGSSKGDVETKTCCSRETTHARLEGDQHFSKNRGCNIVTQVVRCF